MMFMQPLSRKVMVALLMVAIGLPATSSAQPDLILHDLEGVERRLSDHRGQWVVLNFWATWCPPCVHEMPELSKFHELHKDRDAFVWGVDFEKIEPATLEAFLNKVKVTYPIVGIGQKPVNPFGKDGKIRVLPTTFFIAPDGHYAGKHEGVLTVAKIESLIAQFADERATAGEN